MLQARRVTREALDIVDEQGDRVGRVTLPTGKGLFGAAKGTVYLKRVPPAPAPKQDSAA